MSRNRMIGIGMVVAGGALLFFGLKEADAFGSRIGELWSGRPSNEALAMMIGGGLLVLGGLGAALKGGAKA